jgi:hypothetical protein
MPRWRERAEERRIGRAAGHGRAVGKIPFVAKPVRLGLTVDEHSTANDFTA